ncbi:MAG: P-II family nitrogen regulator [Acidobacteria bacterium]|nr:P-II family nitrogen regulator [Acidobacteriota bacterium]
MQEIKAIIRTDRLENVIDALHALSNMPGVTVSTVSGFGRRTSRTGPGIFDEMDFTKLEAVVEDASVQSVIDTIVQHARTGGPGDGRIFVMPVLQAIRIREYVVQHGDQ